MTELSHEDIKNAILGVGTDANSAPSPEESHLALPDVGVVLPDTPYEGFVGSEPTDEEREGFRAGKQQVHEYHKGRQPESSQTKDVLSGFPNWAKYAIGSLAASIVFAGGAVAYHGYQIKRSNDIVEDLSKPNETSATAPAKTPAEKPVKNEFEPITPVILTKAEVATLRAGDSKASHKILDAKLMPRIQQAIDQIYANKKRGAAALDDLDLTALAPSNVATSDLAVLATVDNKYKPEMCHTTPNDGTIDFCNSTSTTKIELGKPIDFWIHDFTTETDHNLPSDAHAEIVDGNRLILTAND